ncbi:MAG: glycerophosphodiester phosphodiesterase [Thermomicrobiales bacterium]|nr:glycerophosphodiester phosphodiesterase [Thermomicrobiales bacterium]
MLVYAHRGSSGRLPENTLAALRGAIADGADGVEFDLRAARDGELVLLHDRALDRTTDGTGPVDAMPLAALRRFRTANGEPVPTFVEVLTAIGGQTALDIELKQPGIEPAVLATLRAARIAPWLISSFDWASLEVVRALDPAAPLWPLSRRCDDALLDFATRISAAGVAVGAAAFTSKVASTLRRLGLSAAVWTVNDPVEACRLRDLGVAILITDRPAHIRRALAEDHRSR